MLDNPITVIMVAPFMGLFLWLSWTGFQSILKWKWGDELVGLGVWFPLLAVFFGLAPFEKGYGWLFTAIGVFVFIICGRKDGSGAKTTEVKATTKNGPEGPGNTISVQAAEDKPRDNIRTGTSDTYKARQQPSQINTASDLEQLSGEELVAKKREWVKEVERQKLEAIRIGIPRNFRIIGDCIYCKTHGEHAFTGVQWKCLTCSQYYDSVDLNKSALAAIATASKLIEPGPRQ